MQHDEEEVFIPQISLQNDWYSELRHGSGKLWLCKTEHGGATVYGEVQASRSSGSLVCTNGFTAEFVNKHVLSLASRVDEMRSYFFNPVKTINVHNKAVRNLDVSTGGALGVSCGDDGRLLIWETATGDIRRSLDGHINDVTHCRFFPSGAVVLSGGMDMRLKIWSVEDGSCPVTLIGHTGAVTDTVIIEKGRNIVSCGRDGSAKLWDCGTSKCLVNLYAGSSVINSCCMQDYTSNSFTRVSARSDREVGTENKLLVLACEDGLCVATDVFSRSQVFGISCGSAINACTFFDENLVALGLENGFIQLCDIRKSGESVLRVRHGKSRVVSLQEFMERSLLIGKGDGSCSCIRPFETAKFVSMEFSGPDCDPVYDVVRSEKHVFTACRDGHIRKYRMDLNN